MIRSGWNRRAAAIASATVPASATTWNPGRRSSSDDEALSDDLVVVDDEERQGPAPASVGVVSMASFMSGCSRRRRWLAGQPDLDGRAGRRALEEHRRADRGGPRSHVREPLVAEPAWTPAGSKPRPLSVIRMRSSPAAGRRRHDRTSRAGVPGDVAERLVREAEEVGDRVGVGLVGGGEIAARGRSSSCGGTPRRSRRGRPRASLPPRSSGRRPKMKLRMSWIVRWRLSIARSTRRSTSAGSSRTSSGTSSSDSPTAYRLWMIPSWRSAPIRSRSSTTASARPARGARAFSIAIPAWRANVSTSALVVLGELVAPSLVGEVQVADRAPLDRDRDAEEAVHRRVIRREAVAPGVSRDVGDPDGAVLADDQAEEPAPARQRRSAPGSPRRCRT